METDVKLSSEIQRAKLPLDERRACGPASSKLLCDMTAESRLRQRIHNLADSGREFDQSNRQVVTSS